MFPACLRSVVTCLYRELDTPMSMKLLKALEEERYDEIVRTRVSPNDYTESEDYFKDSCAVNFLRKCVDIPLKGVDAEAEGMRVWLESEERCYRTNVRFLKHLHNGPFEDPADARIDEILRRLRKTFQRILGPVPLYLPEGGFGPGSTISDRRQYATVPDKMSSRPTCSTAARAFLDEWRHTAWFRYLAAEHPHNSDPRVCDEEELLFVNKDATVKRGICLGPSINGFYQSGVGRTIRGRLKSIGIDLKTGQGTHVQVARVASRDDGDATIDEKSASDSQAYRFVQYLCEETWFDLLDSLRIGTCRLPDGRLWKLQKFSAMGNGYTFELETCMFLSMAITAMELVGLEPQPGKNVFVYGDDIIVPKTASTTLIALLKYCGFESNMTKTFQYGRFRESCGGDFFCGDPVSSYKVEEYPREPQDWIKLANGVRRMALVSDDGVWTRPYLRKVWFKVLDQLPKSIKCLRGPEWLGDVLIHDSVPDFDKIEDGPCHNGFIRNGIRVWRVYQPISKAVRLEHWKPGIQLASALAGVRSSGPIPRDSVSGYYFCLVPSFGRERPTNMYEFVKAQALGPYREEWVRGESS